MMILSPKIKSTQPKNGFNFLPSILRDKKVPIKTPDMVQATTEMISFQFIPAIFGSPKNPISDFAAIINKVVPTASFMGSFNRTTNVGTIRNPPPVPTNPVIIPTTNPSMEINV